MKIRSGFVSNSSSSSFIVATDDEQGHVELVIKVNLSNYGEVLKTKEEVDAYFYERWGQYDESEWVKEKLHTCLDAIARGKVIIAGDFTDDSDGEEAFLCNNGIPASPDIEIIESEGGY